MSLCRDRTWEQSDMDLAMFSFRDWDWRNYPGFFPKASSTQCYYKAFYPRRISMFFAQQVADKRHGYA